MGKRLSKAEIIERSKPKTKDIEIPEWDDAVITLRKLNSSTALTLRELIKDGKPTTNDYFYLLLVESVVDDKGSKVYTLEEAKDIDATILNKLLTEIASFNGMDVSKAKEQLKNQNGFSPSD
jgi:hypothetical protein